MEPPEEAARPPALPTPQIPDVNGPDALAEPLLGPNFQDNHEMSQRMRVTAQALCALVLVLSCIGSVTMIISEAVQGVRQSFYCSSGKHKRFAPLSCVIPLAITAVLCHLAVVVALGFIGHFALHAGSRAFDGAIWRPEEQREMLRANLRSWRYKSNCVLFIAAAVYLIAGPACAGLARMAFIFLATGFLTLYATMLFFDDDVEQARLPPRFLRFLGVYMLIGLTFSVYTWGFLERLGLGKTPGDSGSRWNPGNATGTGSQTYLKNALKTICTVTGRAQFSPARCTVPLDFASGISLWWVASPLFASLLAPGKLRKVLQHWRWRVDLLMILGIFLLTMIMRDECKPSAPIAFGLAEVGAYAVMFLLLLRRLNPLACDPWRGPLEHLVTDATSMAPAEGVTADERQCSICLSELVGQAVCRAPCGHDFHMQCLEDWVLLARSPSPGCPLCRQSLNVPEPAACLLFTGSLRVAV